MTQPNVDWRDECECCQHTLEEKTDICPICIVQKLFRGKWKLLILWQLKDGEKRFGQLRKAIPATQGSLTKQLRELEADGIIHRKIYDIIPPKVEYSLTEMGGSFLPIMENMRLWGTIYLASLSEEK